MSSESCIEVLPRTLLERSEVVVRTWRTWLRQKREHGVVKSCEIEEFKAYSGAVCTAVVKQEVEFCKNFSFPEPCSLTAILERKKMTKN